MKRRELGQNKNPVRWELGQNRYCVSSRRREASSSRRIQIFFLMKN